MATTVTINGEKRAIDADPETPLLWVLRDDLKLTGTKYGCGVSLCGACTVHIDGSPQRSCVVTLKDVDGKSITTIEGVQGKVASAVQAAWIAHDVVQCGYCLLTENAKPSDSDIDAAMDGNICRCNTYHRIRAAIHTAAKTLEG
jgi:isoquinoline 1-oxidoreductase alpha subunit